MHSIQIHNCGTVVICNCTVFVVLLSVPNKVCVAGYSSALCRVWLISVGLERDSSRSLAVNSSASHARILCSICREFLCY